MQQIILIILLLAFGGRLDYAEHDFHLSKGSLKYSDSEKALQLSVHVFIDDLENALAAKGADSMNLFKNTEHKNADEFINRYLIEQFKVQVDENPVSFEYLGREMSEDYAGVWMYMEALEIEKPVNMKVDNRILLELFDDQKNILNVKVHGKTDYLTFDIEDSSHLLSWE